MRGSARGGPGETNMIYKLVYLSSVRKDWKDEELVALLEKSRSNNARCDVTGMLLYHRRTFLQLLEGPEKKVLETHDRILRDARHRDARTLLSGSYDERSFPDWSMGFCAADDAQMEAIDGFTRYLTDEHALHDDSGDSALDLLESFRDNARSNL